jgi:hypothetical protein
MMSNEEFDRKMDFIVNQQAQFVVDMDKLREAQVKTEGAIDRLTAAQVKTDGEITRLTAAQAKTEEVVTRLAYVTHAGFKGVNDKINALVDSQILAEASHKQTEEALRKLTDTVDRYVRNRSNGTG